MLDDFDIDVPEEEDEDLEEFELEEPPEERDNRTFLLVAAGLGGLMLVSLVCLAIYALFVLPGRREAQDAANATAIAQNTAVALALTQTAGAQAFTATPSNTAAPTSTETPAAVVTDDESGAGPTADPRTATVQALLTQAAVAQTQAAEALLTTTVTPTATALPDTGFIDDVGAPGLLAMASLLVVVIFLARRARLAEG